MFTCKLGKDRISGSFYEFSYHEFMTYREVKIPAIIHVTTFLNTISFVERLQFGSNSHLSIVGNF